MTEHERRLLASLNTALGEITEYFKDENITDIMVNPDGKVWLDHLKKGQFVTKTILSVDDRFRVINTVATSCNSVCNSQNPSISANIPVLGYRFQGDIPPIAENPFFVIRKPAILKFALDDYVARRELSLAHKEVLVKAAHRKKNLLIVGGTSSGKTTLGNAFLKEICQTATDPRVFLLEDSKELVSLSANTTRLLTDINNNIDMSYLLRICMRCNPERIIVGEIRDGKTALGLLKAFNSGHPGGFSTIHADSAEKGLKKLLQYLAEEIREPSPLIVSEAIDIVVYMERTPEGRRVKEILQLENELTADNKFIFKEL